MRLFFEDVSIGLGLYIGEVVVRNLGGRWGLAKKAPSPRIVGLCGIEWLDPLGRMEKRLTRGETASLDAWYRGIERQVRTAGQ